MAKNLKSVDQIESEVEKIFDSIAASGFRLTRTDLMSVDSYRRLVMAAATTTPSGCQWRRWTVLALIALAWWVVKLLPSSGSSSSSDCLLRLPDPLLNAFVPPSRCDFCRNISQVERVHSL